MEGGGLVTYEEARKEFERQLDSREEYKKVLKEYYEKHGDIPMGHIDSWLKLKNEPHWRDDPYIMKRIHKAAKKAVKNAKKNK